VRDADVTDALPIFTDFENNGSVLDFDGVGFAVFPTNPGIVIARGSGFFRVSEQQDNRNYNGSTGDTDMADAILIRNSTSTCGPAVMGTASGLVGPVITTDGVRGAAFVTSESQENGRDLNGDGDSGDLVVRWFRF
jgi:hypothetical protein